MIITKKKYKKNKKKIYIEFDTKNGLPCASSNLHCVYVVHFMYYEICTSSVNLHALSTVYLEKCTFMHIANASTLVQVLVQMQVCYLLVCKPASDTPPAARFISQVNILQCAVFDICPTCILYKMSCALHIVQGNVQVNDDHLLVHCTNQ